MTDNLTGLGGIEEGAAPVDVSEKRLINGRADVNQIVPVVHHFAYDCYRDGNKNHWLPQEVAMQKDYDQWKSRDALTDDERHLILRNLSFFSTAESLISNNLVLSVYRILSSPEARLYLLRQAFEEAVHTDTFVYMCDALNLEDESVFNGYREIPSITAKDAWALQYTQSLEDPDFRPDTQERAQQFLRDLIAFYVIFEGCFLYTGFSMIQALGRRNKMPGVVEMFRYVQRDEAVHVRFGTALVNGLKGENPELWTPEFQSEIRNMFARGYVLESRYIDDALPNGILGLNADASKQYQRFMMDRRLESIGLAPLFGGNTENPYPWLSEAAEMSAERNFFETRVTEYQQGGLDWDD